jgi:hypothetical protein
MRRTHAGENHTLKILSIWQIIGRNHQRQLMFRLGRGTEDQTIEIRIVTEGV